MILPFYRILENEEGGFHEVLEIITIPRAGYFALAPLNLKRADDVVKIIMPLAEESGLILNANKKAICFSCCVNQKKINDLS